MVKNAVIVPAGAKGGFVAKQLPDPAVDREAWLAEGVACYRTFISCLLDLTDNYVTGADGSAARRRRRRRSAATTATTPTWSSPPTRAPRRSATSPTASPTDYGFWLGDAFASGGSVGYDHKAMGITARGAWESVKYHFRELGVDTQTQDFTVVGIGDMSGDVFGNGMLLSEHIRLVAAFDHRHIFLDPDPDAAQLLRRAAPAVRAAALVAGPTTTPSLISAGGGVYPRTLEGDPDQPRRSRAALGIAGRGHRKLTPTELIHAILLAPVDLLWNGGIGTYVKASTETHADAGDKANDALRVDGDRAAVPGRRRGRQPRLHPARPRSSTPAPAGRSTPTPSTTPPASTPPTTR